MNNFGDRRIAVIGLRDNPNTGRKTDSFLKKRNIGLKSYQEIFVDPFKVLEQIPDDERYNIYYTAGTTNFDEESGGRTFVKQAIIPFDFDNIDVDNIDSYVDIFCKVTKLLKGQVGIVVTGNGLQFVVLLHESFEREYFQQNKKSYVNLCKLMETQFAENQLIGNVDTSVFSSNHLLRFPETENRKPKGTTRASRHTEMLESVDFDLADWGEAVVNTRSDWTDDTRYRIPIDTVGVQKECLFLQNCKLNATTLPEPQWRASLSVLSRLDKGRDLCHEYSRPHPEYDAGKTDDKIDQALKFPPYLCNTINDLWRGCKNCVHWQKVKTPVSIRGDGFFQTENNNFWHLTDKGKAKEPAYEDIMKKLWLGSGHKHVSLDKGGGIFTWEDKIWVEKSNERIGEFLNIVAFKPLPKRIHHDEFRTLLRYTNVHDSDFLTEINPGLINTQNGIYDIEKNKIIPHSPEFGFPYVLDFAADVEADCPGWDKFLNEVTNGREELVDILQEFIGYVLSFSDPHKGEKALFLYGRGGNGKSVFIDVIGKLIGSENFSTQPLNLLATNLNSRMHLRFKMANLLEETGNFHEETFKNLTTGGTITAKKLFKDVTQFKNYAKLVTACNTLPSFKNYSSATTRRLLIVPFDFTPKNRNAYLREELCEELPGILNWAAHGYLRLRKNNYRFSESTILENMVKKLLSFSSAPLIEFINAKIDYETADEKNFVSISSLYNLWGEFQFSLHLKPMSKFKFSHEFKEALLQLTGKRFRTEGIYDSKVHTQSIRNIKLKKEEK